MSLSHVSSRALASYRSRSIPVLGDAFAALASPKLTRTPNNQHQSPKERGSYKIEGDKIRTDPASPS